MKIVRQLLRDRLLEKIPTIAKIDRYNRQYENLEDNEAADYDSGVVYIEVIPSRWETMGGGKLQEADAVLRLHVCRTFFGDSSSGEDVADPFESFTFPAQVFQALQSFTLIDEDGRTIARTLTRTASTEDNDHNGLEIDLIEFSTRLTDYSAVKKIFKVEATPTIEVLPEPEL